MKDACTRKEKQAGTSCVDKGIIYSNICVYVLINRKSLAHSFREIICTYCLYLLMIKYFRLIKFSHYMEVIDNLPVKDPMWSTESSSVNIKFLKKPRLKNIITTNLRKNDLKWRLEICLHKWLEHLLCAQSYEP